jgi:hypothetical protein
MLISRAEMKKRINEYAKGNERCSWLTEDERIDIGFEASAVAERTGCSFISVFDNMVFVRSSTKGRPKG